MTYWRLIDRLKSNLTPFARKLRSNLIPEPVEFLLDHGEIRPRCRNVGPDPGVVVDVHDGVKSSGGDHVDDIGNALEPCWINIPRRRRGVEVVYHRSVSRFISQRCTCCHLHAHVTGKRTPLYPAVLISVT